MYIISTYEYLFLITLRCFRKGIAELVNYIIPEIYHLNA